MKRKFYRSRSQYQSTKLGPCPAGALQSLLCCLLVGVRGEGGQTTDFKELLVCDLSLQLSPCSGGDTWVIR